MFSIKGNIQRIAQIYIFLKKACSIIREVFHLDTCRFCYYGSQKSENCSSENEVISSSENYYAISSIGALVEGWTLIIPKKHCCSMKLIYSREDFIMFANSIIKALFSCYGPLIIFEHGPNREGSETSCGTNHAHVHLVPYHSLHSQLEKTNMKWENCQFSKISNMVGDNEYLLYGEATNSWDDFSGQVHILEKPISQFFRQIIAQDLGISEKYNYKLYPDSTLTKKTVEKLKTYMNKHSGD